MCCFVTSFYSIVGTFLYFECGFPGNHLLLHMVFEGSDSAYYAFKELDYFARRILCSWTLLLVSTPRPPTELVTYGLWQSHPCVSFITI